MTRANRPRQRGEGALAPRPVRSPVPPPMDERRTGSAPGSTARQCENDEAPRPWSEPLASEVAGVPRNARENRARKQDAVTQAADTAVRNVTIYEQVNDLTDQRIMHRNCAQAPIHRIPEANCLRWLPEFRIDAQSGHYCLCAHRPTDRELFANVALEQVPGAIIVKQSGNHATFRSSVRRWPRRMSIPQKRSSTC